MTANQQLSGLIRPFNMDPEECQAMFVRPLPDRLVMCLVLQHSPGMDTELAEGVYYSASDEFIRELTVCATHAPTWDITTKFALDCSLSDQVSPRLLPLAENQESWQIRGLYVQVAFHDSALVDTFDPVHCTGYAMSVYDHIVCTTGILNPSRQRALEVEPNIARDYRMMLGDLYREQVGIWSLKLVQIRNMAMIRCRAVLADLDPDEEYAAYQAAGGYCMDFAAQRKQTKSVEHTEIRTLAEALHPRPNKSK